MSSPSLCLPTLYRIAAPARIRPGALYPAFRRRQSECCTGRIASQIVQRQSWPRVPQSLGVTEDESSKSHPAIMSTTERAIAGAAEAHAGQRDNAGDVPRRE
jgi:hypothetical protein